MEKVERGGAALLLFCAPRFTLSPDTRSSPTHSFPCLSAPLTPSVPSARQPEFLFQVLTDFSLTAFAPPRLYKQRITASFLLIMSLFCVRRGQISSLTNQLNPFLPVKTSSVWLKIGAFPCDGAAHAAALRALNESF